MANRIFKRKIYSRLVEWKELRHGKTALLIEGARRIGKSTIAEEFARNEYESYIVIDFSLADPEMRELFDHISRLDYFFLRLQAQTGVTLHERKSVIIFDEVQLFPKARQAIKHLVKDGRYDYIETGSLISIKKNIADILIPSEETRIAMNPMDFEEFLWAIGRKPSYDFIRTMYENMEPAGNAMHRTLMREFRLYMLVGGMPQAIETYLEENNLAQVDAVKRDILRLYADDFRRIDEKGRAATIFNSIPAELARNKLRYQVGSVIDNGRPSRLDEIFADIGDSKTVNYSFRANDPSIGLALHAGFDFFKMYLADTGLFVTLAFLDKDYIDNDIYRRLLSDKLPVDLGYLFENVVAQMLTAAGHSLYYYTFRKDEISSTYEIDFLISEGSRIAPIEVKSSGYIAHKSLDEFRQKFSSRISRSYLIYTKDLRREGDVLCLPVYMTGLL